MTNDTPASIEEYMATIPQHARADMERLRQTIKVAAPEAKEAISYKMPTLQQDGLVVAYSAHKKHYSLHAVSGEIQEAYTDELAPYVMTKGSIHFNYGEPLPTELVKKLVEARVQENKARQKDKELRRAQRKGDKTMRFMMIVKANEESEAGILPSRKLVEAMGRFNQEMVDAGVMLAGEGLLPSSKGARVHFRDGKRTVTDGPFAETKELIAGYWLIEVDSLQEAIDWAKRVPDPMEEGEEAVIEIRQIGEIEDWPEEIVTAEEREREQRMRQQLTSAGTA